MTVQIKALLAIVLLLGALAAGWFVRAWYDGSREAVLLAAQAETRDKMVELAGDIATANEVAISKIRINNRNIYHATETEIRNNPAYDCAVPAAGVGLLNAARGAARPAASESDASVRGNAAH